MDGQRTVGLLMSLRQGRLAQSDRDEAGFTLIETMVAMFVFVIILALVTPMYIVMSKSSSTTDALTQEDSAVHPALVLMTNQVASGENLFTCPSATYAVSGSNPCTAPTSTTTSSSNNVFVVYTDNLHGGTCSQWAVISGQLETRSWSYSSQTSTSFTTTPIAFTIPVSGVSVVNSSTNYPFSISGGTGNLLAVKLKLQFQAGSSAFWVQTAMAAQGGFALPSSSPCLPPPTSLT